ncbi:MAG: alpha-galactosidase [Lachnospiraceae bacterium]|nr:alpha-galactosidase [Lachnospiraceae bacterium]
MIRQTKDNVFYLETANSSYLFHILPGGVAEHLHYGAVLVPAGTEPDDALLSMIAQGLSDKQRYPGGNMIQYSTETGPLCLESLCTECSSFGKGDIRDPFLELEFSDGNTTCDFVYENAQIRQGRQEPAGLPCAVADDSVGELTVRFRERESGLLLELFYTVFADTDVITRWARLTVPEDRQDAVTVKRLLSAQLDLHETGLRFSGFHGHWADEMHRSDMTVTAGRAVSEGLWAGVSGSRSNPFVMISREDTTEESGSCIGVNLVYSGDHYEALSADGFDRSRFVTGIQPVGFSWRLEPGETLSAPEAVFCYSDRGFGGMSRQMHRFVRRHIIRGSWRDKPRPVLLNSWEANYFRFDDKKLLKQAKEAADLGIELFVLDDGWFGARDDDTCSLGDWTENRKKLPNGLGSLADRIHGLGIRFGIWVEPEMVNERSELFAKHPEWAVRVPGRAHATGRNQMILDLTRREVQDFLIREMARVFSEGKVDYVKWDMNRIFSDRFSAALPAERQGEFAHRYVLGLYRVMRELVQTFPDVLFEGCASGGNRFDLGILSFFPQIWGSDDTDAVCRADIQRGYSYGYPLSTVGAHVSASPNHQTLNAAPLQTRFAVAAFGCLGYECDPCDLSAEERKAIREQIVWYKEWRGVFFTGEVYRLEGDAIAVVSGDPSDGRAAVLLLQRENRPNRPFLQLRMSGLAPEKVYHVTNEAVPVRMSDFGSLANMVSPVHVREGGLVQALGDRFYHMPSDIEDQKLPGSALCTAGIRLLPNYAGTGFGEGTRMFRTSDARLLLFTPEDGVVS